MAKTIRRIMAAGIVAAVAVTLVLSSGPAMARSVDCARGDRDCFGTKQADTIQAEGRNTVNGRAGDDTITSLGGASEIFGRAGNDTITDEGGRSDLKGGPGNDQIRALKGRNVVDGGSGIDVINAENGELDEIDCGPGRDLVSYDLDLDVLDNCEIRLF